VNSWDINLRNRGEHIISQQAMSVVSLEFFLRDGCSLEEVCQFGDLPLDEVVIGVLSTPELPPASSSINGLVGGGLLADSVAMVFKARVAQKG
jgi:hypothetical protein